MPETVAATLWRSQRWDQISSHSTSGPLILWDFKTDKNNLLFYCLKNFRSVFFFFFACLFLVANSQVHLNTEVIYGILQINLMVDFSVETEGETLSSFFNFCFESSFSKCLVQFSSVAQLCPTLCDPMNRSTPGLPVHHQLPEFTQTHVHGVGDAIQPSHPLTSPSPPAPNPSQPQSLFQ